jgi:chromosome segregation ATPase
MTEDADELAARVAELEGALSSIAGSLLSSPLTVSDFSGEDIARPILSAISQLKTSADSADDANDQLSEVRSSLLRVHALILADQKSSETTFAWRTICGQIESAYIDLHAKYNQQFGEIASLTVEKAELAAKYNEVREAGVGSQASFLLDFDELKRKYQAEVDRTKEAAQQMVANERAKAAASEQATQVLTTEATNYILQSVSRLVDFPDRFEFGFKNFADVDRPEYFVSRLLWHIREWKRGLIDKGRKDQEESHMLSDGLKYVRTQILGRDAPDGRSVPQQVVLAYNTLKKQLAERDNLKSAESAEVVHLKRALEQLRSDLSALSPGDGGTHGDLAGEISSLVAGLRTRLTALDDDNRQRGDRITELTNALELLRKQVLSTAAPNSQTAEASAPIADPTEMVRTLTASLRGLRTRLTELDGEIASRDEKLEQYAHALERIATHLLDSAVDGTEPSEVVISILGKIDAIQRRTSSEGCAPLSDACDRK